MNEDSRKKVLNCISDLDCSPLIFYGYDSKVDEFVKEEHTINDMILRALYLCEKYPSYTIKGDYESSTSRWRSSFDIWRHIINYYPDVTLFDVMKGLYEIRDECGGQYCSTIQRRTFRSKVACGFRKDHNWGGWSNEQSYTGTYFNYDEYGLAWKEWENI